ncbi:hypothetical protein EEB19_13660 [Gordonia sp. OPL2]|nr:hypothetical protein EEB19_13660 [Gordonia sp. OPL2]
MAAPYPAPRISQYSEDIWAVGGNSGCRGAIHVGIAVDRTKPGKAFVTYTPRPFVGDGPAWRRKPVCNLQVTARMDIVRGEGWSRNITAGPRGGRAAHLTLTPGSGPHMLEFFTEGVQWGTRNFVLIP